MEESARQESATDPPVEKARCFVCGEPFGTYDLTVAPTGDMDYRRHYVWCPGLEAAKDA